VPLDAVLLGPQWHGAAPLFQLLCLAGIFSMLSFVGYWVYLSRGLTAQLMRYSLLSLAIRVVTILGGSAWGVEGVAAGFAAAPLVAWPISLWWLSRCTVIPVAQLVSGALRILLLAAPAGCASWGVATLLADSPGLLACAASIGAGALVYVVAAFCSRRIGQDVREVVDFVRRARA
jgi:PST family polysaccharide transporter